MSHNMIENLRFARQKWMAGLEGVSQEEGFKRFGQMNSIGWMVGHLASFEQFAFLEIAQGKVISEAVKACRFGQPASTPPLDEMVAAWHQIIEASEPYLDSLSNEQLASHLSWRGKSLHDNIGTLIWRQTWHYWYHLGEMQAIRQMLGHKDLPQFVGAIPPEMHFSREQPSPAKALVARMVDGLNDHLIEGQEQFWAEDMKWYGPAGIGLKPSLKAFQEEHQRPFLHAFPDKEAFDEIRIAEGDYVAAKGYQQVTHKGDYLGIPASGESLQIRYMDFWRAEGDKLVENWVMIDLLHFLEQLGYNIEKVLKFIGSKPPSFFDEIE